MAWLTLRGVQVPVRRDAAAAHPPLGGEGWAGSPQRMFHIPTWQGLLVLLRELEIPFARLIIVWFVAFIGLCHVALPRARSVGASGIVRPLRPPSATRVIAAARSTRWVWAEVRWRWTLNVL